jgi:hypothetical protein
MGERQFDPNDANGFAAAAAALNINSDIIGAGYAYWDRLRCGRPCPDRSDIDPVIDIPVLAPHIMLIEVRHEPLDFRFRLIGGAVRQNFSRDYTGHWFSEYPTVAAGSDIWRRHKQVAELGWPILQIPAYVGPHNDFGRVASVLLPLTIPRPGWGLQMMFLDFIRR